jgi:ankyrin repeat protein
MSKRRRESSVDEGRKSARAKTDTGAIHILNSKCNQRLHEAVLSSNKQVVMEVIKAGSDINEEFNGMTPLHAAVLEGNGAMVAYLLSFTFIDVNLLDNNGKTALYLAIEQNYVSIIECLVEANGIELNLQAPHRESVLFLVASLGRTAIVTRLLNYGADVNLKNEHELQRTALHAAVVHGRVETVAALLMTKGIEVDVCDNEGNTALLLAIQMRDLEMVTQLLRAGANVNLRNGARYDCQTALHLAADIGDTPIVNALLTAGADVYAINEDFDSPLHIAARKGRVGVVKALIDANALVLLLCNAQFQSPADVARISGYLEIAGQLDNAIQRFFSAPRLPAQLCLEEHQQCAEKNPEQAVNVLNSQTLYRAISDRDKRTVSSLLTELKINPNISIKGVTLLHLASTIANGEEIVEELLQQGALVDLPCNGETALYKAAALGYKKTVAMLLTHGADSNCKNKEGKTALHAAVKGSHIGVIPLLIMSGAQIDAIDDNGDSALHIAAQVKEEAAQARIKIVEYLIGAGANVNLTNKGGQHALSITAMCGIVTLLQTLIACGASVDLVDLNRNTALHKAVEYRHAEVVRVLLETSGIDSVINLKNAGGKTALALALMRNYPVPKIREAIEQALSNPERGNRKR